MLKSVSRVATNVVPKSADVLSQIASTNSGDPGDLASASTDAGPPRFRRKKQDLYNGGTHMDHSTPRLAVDVLTEPSDA